MSLRLRDEDGQAVLMTVLFLVLLLGAAGLTIDVGAWYREQRQAQSTADAAALAGAQALPADAATAGVLAQQYASANGGGVPTGGITFQSTYMTDDTVSVKVQRTAPSFFARLFSVSSVSVGATASARAGTPDQVLGVAPIVVNKLHPMLSGPGCPCFGVETTLPLGKDGAPGAFGLIDLNGGSNSAAELADWIQNGYPDYLDLGQYESDPGAKFNSNGVQDALASKVGKELLFPVYDTLDGNGANATYDVIGWVAFHLDCVGTVGSDGQCVADHGSSADLTGYFTRVIWQGLLTKTKSTLPDFGVYSVSLVH